MSSAAAAAAAAAAVVTSVTFHCDGDGAVSLIISRHISSQSFMNCRGGNVCPFPNWINPKVEEDWRDFILEISEYLVGKFYPPNLSLWLVWSAMRNQAQSYAVADHRRKLILVSSLVGAEKDDQGTPSFRMSLSWPRFSWPKAAPLRLAPMQLLIAQNQSVQLSFIAQNSFQLKSLL